MLSIKNLSGLIKNELAKMRLNLQMDKNLKKNQHTASAKCENAPSVTHWWQPKKMTIP